MIGVIAFVTTAVVATATSKGVGYIDKDFGANCTDLTNLRAAWHYNWKASPTCSGVEFVPMIWGAGNIGELTNIRDRGYRALLGFNEPDNTGQSDMTTDQALSLWPQLEATGLRLGSPACTEGGSYSWLKAFMQGAQEKGYRVDFLALHWYGDCHKPASVGTFLQQMYDAYGLPMWLTEFSCFQGTAAVNEEFFRQVQPFLRRARGLERYAWFADRYPTDRKDYQGVTLFDKDGHRTVLGDLYHVAEDGVADLIV